MKYLFYHKLPKTTLWQGECPNTSIWLAHSVLLSPCLWPLEHAIQQMDPMHTKHSSGTLVPLQFLHRHISLNSGPQWADCNVNDAEMESEVGCEVGTTTLYISPARPNSPQLPPTPASQLPYSHRAAPWLLPGSGYETEICQSMDYLWDLILILPGWTLTQGREKK